MMYQPLVTCHSTYNATSYAKWAGVVIKSTLDSNRKHYPFSNDINPYSLQLQGYKLKIFRIIGSVYNHIIIII